MENICGQYATQSVLGKRVIDNSNSDWGYGGSQRSNNFPIFALVILGMI